MKKLRTVRGVHDLLPDDLHKHKKVIKAGLNISSKYCYSEIEIPIFEFSEVFKKPLGKSSDIVTKENYIFKDRSDDELMLRPEGTSGVVRAFLNAGLVQDIPQRFSYFGPMFRYERPQKGRLRQFKQFGVECIGISNSMADIEVISLGYEFLKKLNLTDKITLKINSLGDADSRLNYRKVLINYLNDYKFKLSKDSVKRLSENPLRILDSKNEIDQKILINAPNVLDYLNEVSKERFENVCEDEDHYTKWYVLHAEANAILKVASSTQSCQGATLYITLSPCKECSKLIHQSGIKRVVYATAYKDLSGVDFLKKAGVVVEHFSLENNIV